MKITRSLTVRFGIVAAGLAVAAGSLTAQTSHILVPADKVQFAPGPPHLPPGAQVAVLEGNPKEKGAVTLRLKFPANYAIPPHWHSMAERVTVMTGALNVGMGDRLDRNSSQRLDVGGFVSLPANMHHFAWTSTETVVQINLEGPFDIFYVNATDDPQAAARR